MSAEWKKKIIQSQSQAYKQFYGGKHQSVKEEKKKNENKSGANAGK